MTISRYVIITSLAVLFLAGCGGETSNSPDLAGSSPLAVGGGNPAATGPPSSAATATPTPTPQPTPTPTPAPAAPAFDYCGAPANPWHYNLCGGNLIYAPSGNFCAYFACIPSFWSHTAGYVDECADGKYSHSGGRSGACSYHGGEMAPLYSP